MKTRIIIAAIHTWNWEKAQEFIENHKEYDVKLVTKKEDLTEELLKDFKPDWVMFVHWSWILPESIYGKYKCVVFHVSDVPNGKGGSPVQNQIVDGIANTKVSAISVDAGIDTGNVYLKKDLSLEGSAEEIFIRSSNIVFEEMIPYIVENNPVAVPQEDGGYTYRRRKPGQSEFPQEGNLKLAFDHIRMLDAEGYPKAYIEWGDYRFEFDRAKLIVGAIEADVRITLRND